MRSKGLKCGKDQGEEKLLEKGAGRGGVEPPGEWGWGRAGAGLIGAPRRSEEHTLNSSHTS